MCGGKPTLEGGIPMANAERQMPGHVEAAYKDAVDNIIFLKRQQWVATNYALLVYAAIFAISQHIGLTDFARNSLGAGAIGTFFIHLYMMYLFQQAMDKFRRRLYWIYRTYFNGEEQAGLELPLAPQSSWGQWEVVRALVLVSFVGLVFTAIYLWSVR
jgi:hypothetical protein